jgi:hypothetical protein
VNTVPKGVCIVSRPFIYADLIVDSDTIVDAVNCTFGLTCLSLKDDNIRVTVHGAGDSDDALEAFLVRCLNVRTARTAEVAS